MRPDNPYHRSSDRRGAAVAPKIEARIERNKRRFRCPNTGREVNGVSTHGETRPIRIRAQCPICGDIHEWQIVDQDCRIIAADRHSKDARLTQAQSARPGFQRRNTETIKLREQLLDEFSYRLKNTRKCF